MLDEPFSGVDPISTTEITNLLKKLSQSDLGILITDHNVRDTLSVCKRAYIFSQGSTIAHGTPKNIIEHNQVRKEYLGENFKI